MRTVRIRKVNGVIVEHTIDGVDQLSDAGRAELPSKLAMVRNAASAAAAAAKNPKRASDEEKARRLEICNGCEFLIRESGSDDRCGKCGCYLKWKTALETFHCPIGKW